MGVKDLSKIIAELRKEGFRGVSLGSECENAELVPFRNKAMTLITEGGLPYGKIHEFFGLSASGKCVGGETLIATKEGLLPIEDLFAPLVTSNKTVRTVPVHLALEEDRWYRTKKPLQVFNSSNTVEETQRLYYGGKTPVYIFYTRNNHHITGTPEHKIEVVTPREKLKKFISLKDIASDKNKYLIPFKCGSRIYGTNTSLVEYGNFPITLDCNLAYDLGQLCMSITMTNYYGPKIIKNKKEVVEKISKKWEKYGHKIHPHDKEFIKWAVLNELVLSKIATFEIPTAIKKAPRDILLSYIAGIFSMCTRKKDLLELRHQSYHFITQLQAFLLNEGIESTIWFNSRHGYRHLRVYEKNFTKMFSSIMGTASVEDNENERIIYEPIRKIRKSIAGMPVYDIEMPKTHAYVANNLVSHNSYFMYELLAQSQKMYEPTFGIIVDREGAYTYSRGEQLGINNEQLILSTPADTPLPRDAVSFMEKGIISIRKHVPNSHILIILDSVAAFDKDIKREASDMGKGAQSWHEAFRDMLNFVDPLTMLLYSNHVTYTPNPYGNNKTKAGGTATSYYRSCGIALDKKVQLIDEKRGNEVVGDKVQIIVDKTRHGPSFRKLLTPLYYATGVPEYGGYLWMLASRGYIQPKNVKEFQNGKGKVYTYTKEGQTFTFIEGREELILKKFPELVFTSYPEYRQTEEEKVEDPDES